jgi:hypothetical protein
LFGQGSNDGIVVETLLGDGAFTNVLGTSLVERLAMGEHSDLFVT